MVSCQDLPSGFCQSLSVRLSPEAAITATCNAFGEHEANSKDATIGDKMETLLKPVVVRAGAGLFVELGDHRGHAKIGSQHTLKATSRFSSAKIPLRPGRAILCSRRVNSPTHGNAPAPKAVSPSSSSRPAPTLKASPSKWAGSALQRSTPIPSTLPPISTTITASKFCLRLYKTMPSRFVVPLHKKRQRCVSNRSKMQIGGYYPSNYRMAFDPIRSEYTVSLDGLTLRQGTHSVATRYTKR